MLMTRLQASDLFFSRLPFIDEILYENFDAPALTYPEVFDVRNSSRAFESMTGYSGLDLFPEKDQDGGAVTYDSILQLYDKRYTHKTYALGYMISEEGQEDDIDNIITNASPALARSAQTSIETVAWNVFNNGFGSETTPDGGALFSNSHSLIAGGTVDNLIAGDLSVATLESALILMDTLVDERNLPIKVSPSKLVFPSQMRFVVDTVLQSDLLPGTGNNDINPVGSNRVGLSQVMSRYLTGDDDWFVGADQNVAKLIMYWRKEPVTDHVLDFETGTMKSKMTYRNSQGASDYRGWVGAQGA